MAQTLPPSPLPDASAARIGSEGDNAMPAAARLVIEAPEEKNDAPAMSPLGAQTITTLTAEWVEALKVANAEDDRLTVAETAATKIYPPMPRGSRSWEGREVVTAELAAARTLWEAQVRAINTAYGVPALDQAANLAFKAAARIAAKILAMRPTSAAEAALKFGVILERCGDGRGGIDEPGPVRAFLDDLQHLAELDAERP
jgi:hypothetical protein